jgi:hypothetical protein
MSRKLIDHTKYTGRATVRELMRGDRDNSVVGADGKTATAAACERHAIRDPAQAAALLAYAYGFGVALNKGKLNVEAQCDHYKAPAREGFADGQLLAGISLPAEVTAS